MGKDWSECLEQERKIEEAMLRLDQADEKLSNMEFDDIVKSWLFYRNMYYRLTM